MRPAKPLSASMLARGNIASVLSFDEARHIAVNVASLPGLLGSTE